MTAATYKATSALRWSSTGKAACPSNTPPVSHEASPREKERPTWLNAPSRRTHIPPPASFGDQPVEALNGTQTGVDGEVVDGVVAVRLGLEDRSQGQPRHAQRTA